MLGVKEEPDLQLMHDNSWNKTNSRIHEPDNMTIKLILPSHPAKPLTLIPSPIPTNEVYIHWLSNTIWLVVPVMLLVEKLN
jgi:hypothetical protein